MPGSSSEQETATAKYIEVDELIREILIDIAPFHAQYFTVNFKN